MNRDFAFDVKEASGALGDLGTLLPLMIAAVALGGLSPMPVLLGFAAFYVFTAFAYRLPVPVQPMKALVAVMLITQVPPAAVALAGVVIGAVLLVLGATGWIDRLLRLVPQSVISGLQLGLGILLGLVALRMMAEAPVMGVLALIRAGLPAALIFVVLAVPSGLLLGLPGVEMAAPSEASGEGIVAVALGGLALPQLSLTLTNAILLTAIVMQDSFGERAAGVTPRKLAVTSGIANLCLAPLGALPMCHGAGGAAAHRKFGARTGGAPLMIGLALGALALAPGGFAVLALIPGVALAALLLVASADLAFSKRLFDAVPSCRPVIAVTALGVVFWNPLAALILGTIAEMIRKAIVRRIFAGHRA
ncbi:MAG: putative sulfate/molybdate transporter [Roseovarius confluentis]